MELFQIDDDGLLYIGPEIDDWSPIVDTGINVIIDADGGLDIGVSNVSSSLVYMFFPFDDINELPDMEKLNTIGAFAASLIQKNQKVLAHCGMGHNRSALIAGMILYHLGFPKSEIVARIKERRMGALYNRVFRAYLESL